MHHGLFWEVQPAGLTAGAPSACGVLFDDDMNLAAYHLPLDAHPELGNNALLAEALGLRRPRAVRASIGRAIGGGHLRGDGVPVAELVARVRDA